MMEDIVEAHLNSCVECNCLQQARAYRDEVHDFRAVVRKLITEVRKGSVSNPVVEEAETLLRNTDVDYVTDESPLGGQS